MKQSKPVTLETPDHPFRAVRRAAVPLAVFESADPAQTILACNRCLNGKAETVPLLEWDIARGLRGLNEPGKSYFAQLSDEQKGACMSPAGFLAVLGDKLPVADGAGPGVVFAHHMDRFWDDPSVMQALWNTRDTFKGAGVSLVMVGSGSKLPLELKSDAPIFAEDVPSETEIGRIIDSVLKDAEIEPGAIDKPKVIDGLLGYLSAFAVEQSLALSIRGGSVDLDQLWRLKVAALKNAAGLDVTMPTAGFDSMAGNDGIKNLIRMHINGRERPRAVLHLDELEKATAGATGGDLSGTSQAVMEQFLYWTQTKRVKGFLLVGVPGAGKSLTCQLAAAEAKCPLLRASLSTVKGSLVGQSEQQMRNLLASVDAVAQGRVLMLATCNSLDALSPELMARFTLGTIWYDFPTREESESIWQFYCRKYEHSGKHPSPQNWVGREIESCCERAWLWNIPLEEAAKSVVPVCIASASKINRVRQDASGRFLSASTGQVFSTDTTQVVSGRKFNT